MRYFIISLIVFLVSCSSLDEEPNVFGEVQKLSEFENTDFLTTLEADFDSEKNQIYSPTILFCWQEIKDTFESIRDIEGENILSLHNSQTYQGVLNGGYESSIDIQPNGLKAKASFNKNLLFQDPFDVSRYPISFKGEKMQAFEIEGANHQVKIGYYNSDEDFAIVLQPSDTTHEIVLMKTDFTKFTDASSVYQRFVKKSIRSASGKVVEWKTEILHNDFTKIPFIKFNIETEFEEFKNEDVMLNDSLYRIICVWQRSAFVLNESGAVVESEAIVEAEKTEGSEDDITPKRLYFDKDFVVFLRMKNVKEAANYKGQAYPYFMVYISDDELLVSFD